MIQTAPTKITDVFNFIRENPSAKITIDMRTEQKLSGGKSNPMQGRVFKETLHLPIELALPGVAGGYAERLKDQAMSDGLDPSAYQPKERVWGTRIDNSPLIEHKDEHYLEFFVVGSGIVSYVFDENNTRRAEDFVSIEKDKIEGLPAPRDVGSHTQDGLTKKVDVRCVKLANITRIRVDDKIF